jgi:hypothetical protein
MEKTNTKVEKIMNINPEFFGLFAQELEHIEEKEKKEKKENNKKNPIESTRNFDTNTNSILNSNTNSNTNSNSNTNENIVIFISKKETKTIKKLLTLVDRIM